MTNSLDLNVINLLRRNALVKSIFTSEDDTMHRDDLYSNLEAFIDSYIYDSKAHKNKLYLISYYLDRLLRVFFSSPSFSVVKNLNL